MHSEKNYHEGGVIIVAFGLLLEQADSKCTGRGVARESRKWLWGGGADIRNRPGALD